MKLFRLNSAASGSPASRIQTVRALRRVRRDDAESVKIENDVPLRTTSRTYHISVSSGSTGESEATAQQYLTLADGNVDMAISLMFEGGRPPETENANPEPPVRAPILPTREILVPSEPMCSLPQLSSNVFDRFRDFAVETRTYLSYRRRRACVPRDVLHLA